MKKSALFFILFSSLSFAQSGIDQLQVAISELCGSLTGMLPIASMLMVVIGAVIYAAGQMMGAETRARANVWATAALTGAIMGLLIFSIAPGVLGAIYGGEVSCTGSQMCGSVAYDPATQGCCEGIAVYDTSTSECCPGAICPIDNQCTGMCPTMW